MTSSRRAGEPEGSQKRAGAPDEPVAPAGAPPEAAHSAEDDASQVEHDIDELLSEARRERDEYLDLARRTRADFENYRRRAAQEAAEAERRGKGALARELIPVLDSLERALRAAGVDPTDGDLEDSASAEDGFAEGVLLVYRQLRATVERAGVEPYDPTGERFDPTWHEALATRAGEGGGSGVVLETVEKGYRLDGQVLRAAKVIVSQ